MITFEIYFLNSNILSLFIYVFVLILEKMSSLLEDRQLKYIKTGTELVIETVKVGIKAFYLDEDRSRS